MEQLRREQGLNSNQLKVIAITAMTIDHVISVVFPNYPTDWWIIVCHIIGRLTAPIMWFFYCRGLSLYARCKKICFQTVSVCADFPFCI